MVPSVAYGELLQAHHGIDGKSLRIDIGHGKARRGAGGCTYIAAIAIFHSVGRRVAGAMSAFDLALPSTLTQLPTQWAQFSMTIDCLSFRQKVSKYTAFFTFINASGQPSARPPSDWIPSGIPVGVQVIACFGREDQILVAAAQMESVAPWPGRVPKL
ncbi:MULTISPECIES: amidase [unclassified Burkholderia]|uniref:amidase n=1 Tax=unclassified Burkholderia TaxID=2613784 RepID=UPI00214FFE25|nr:MULTISPECIES: amidase [unclassified Burkholderia]MCR4471926.1 amidase [Burkholderia sp. SCN-KJ]